MNIPNRSAQRQLANNVPKVKEELQDDVNQRQLPSDLGNLQKSRTNVEPSAESTMDLLDRYSQLLDELNDEHASTAQTYTALESDIIAREIACGRLMRQHLEIGEQIRLQKNYILAQKDELRRVRTKWEESSLQKDAVVSKIAALASSSATRRVQL